MGYQITITFEDGRTASILVSDETVAVQGLRNVVSISYSATAPQPAPLPAQAAV